MSRATSTSTSGGDPAPGSPYRLDELGWLQFDRLCGAVLEAETELRQVQWHGQSDTWSTADIRGPSTLNAGRTLLRGPATAVAIWIPADAPDWGRSWELAQRLQSLLDDPSSLIADELLLLTNLATESVGATLRGIAFSHSRRLITLGARQIGASVDRHPSIRAQLPSVLGLRDLSGLIDPEVIRRSSFDIARTQGLARVFWTTRAFHRARAVLNTHRFVVLTGPPEMGKTAIAQMLALSQLTDGWEAHECTDLDQVWRAFDADRRQVFIADDAFGSTEYRPDSAERWALGLGRLLGLLDENHWLIWTSRPAPLKAGLRRVQRERGSRRFPSPGEVLVDASDLDLEEKTLILFRHAKAHDIRDPARCLLHAGGVAIVEHPHFTPERIRRFVTDRLDELTDTSAGDTETLSEAIDRQLTSPSEAMRTSFSALTSEHRDLLTAMLDAPAGLIDERRLAATVRRHHSGGFSRAPGELIDRLTDHFLRVTPLGIDWVHPSWRDLVIDELRSDAAARGHFLSECGVDGVMLAVSCQGGSRGERTLPLLSGDADWDLLADRLHALLRELEPGDLARVLLALETALARLDDLRQRLEAVSLARQLLDTTRQTWDRAHQAVPAFLLEAWYRLRDQTPKDVEPPRLAATWAELHPGSTLPVRPGRDELLRADEWLAVAQVLRTYEPGALESLGFFPRDRAIIEHLALSATQTAATVPELRDTAESLLTRIEELMPGLGAGARATLRLAQDARPEEWWVPSDLAAAPSTERVSARTDFTRQDIDRVLDDL